MFRVLAVDDENIEIEAMKVLVPWQEADAVLIATANDGEEGLAKIDETDPDIVITDIKMPRMDGISMIEKAQQNHPDIIFIVLSGYGEYEFTSKAMELGIRHYILKPINEEKIMETLRKAEQEKISFEIDKNKRKDMNETIKKLEPSARRGFFLKALRNSVTDEEYEYYRNHLDIGKVMGLLAFSIAGSTGEEDAEEILSAASTIIGSKAPLSAEIKNVFYFLIKNPELGQLEQDAMMIRRYAISLGFRDIRFAFSDNENLAAARSGIEILLSKPWHEGRLIQSDSIISTDESERLLRRTEWNNIRNVQELYRYASSLDLMMSGAEYSEILRKQIVDVFASMAGCDSVINSDRESIFSIADNAFLRNRAESDEEKRKRMIIRTIFFQLPNSSLSISMIAEEIAHMNDDYFSRYFQKNTGERFSRFVSKERMQCAMDIIQFIPSIPLARLAVLTGYQEDGQYFQKVFKETFGITLATARSRYFPDMN